MQNNISSVTAIIGCGEVGLNYAQALINAGKNIILCETNPSQAFEDFVYKNNIKTHTKMESWLADCDIVLSIVTGGASFAVVKAALPHLSAKTIYADFTTASPDDKREGAKICAEKGVAYVVPAEEHAR